MQFRASSITPSIYKAGRLLAGLNIFSLRHDFPKKKRSKCIEVYDTFLTFFFVHLDLIDNYPDKASCFSLRVNYMI